MTLRSARTLAAGTGLALMISISGAAALPAASPGVVSSDQVRLIYDQVPVRHRSHHHAGSPYYRVNRYGFGHYVHGPNGSYGGYPAGSAGARELQINREMQCRYTPEQC